MLFIHIQDRVSESQKPYNLPKVFTFKLEF